MNCNLLNRSGLRIPLPWMAVSHKGGMQVVFFMSIQIFIGPNSVHIHSDFLKPSLLVSSYVLSS